MDLRTPYRPAPWLALALLLGGGCGTEAPKPPDAVYTVRAKVQALPDPGRPGSQLMLQHEAIPGFADAEGEVVGMESMTMPFPADPALLAGLAPGDVVEATFEVRWGGSPPYRITAMRSLPANTELDLGGGAPMP